MRLSKVSKDSAVLKKRLGVIQNALSDLFSSSSDVHEDRSHEMFYDLSFLRWLRQHGIELKTGQVPYFRQGGTAKAYFIGDKVVKITTNKVEANVAFLAKKRQNPNTVVIDVKKFQDYYAILMPRVDMENIDKSYKRAADLLTVYIDDENFQGIPEDDAQQRHICSAIVKEYGESKEVENCMVDVIKILRQLYDDTGFIHTDVTPTNIGMHQGRFVIPDLGPNQPGDFNPSKELEKIKANRKTLGLPDEPTI